MAGAVVMMMVWQRPEPALQPAGTPPPVVAQVEKPNPAAPTPVEAPLAAPTQAGQPQPESAPAMAPPTQVVVLPPVGSTIERTPKKPAYRPTRIYSVAPAATPQRAAVSRNEPARPEAPASVPESRSPGTGVSLARPLEASVRAPSPETIQESPTPPPTPPARMEPEKATPVPAPPPEPRKATLNAGMIIPVRLVDGLSTERNKPGDRFTATLVNELIADDFVIAERGARVEGQVVASDPGKTNGRADLVVQLIGLHTSDGQDVAIRTDGFERRADPSSSGAPGKVVAGGAIITNGSGGGVAAGGFWYTRANSATLPPETRISFRLGAPVTLTERTR